jgi:hypothetical protein
MVCSLFGLRRNVDDVQEYLVCVEHCNQPVYETFYGASHRMYGIVFNSQDSSWWRIDISGASKSRLRYAVSKVYQCDHVRSELMIK